MHDTDTGLAPPQRRSRTFQHPGFDRHVRWRSQPGRRVKAMHRQNITRASVIDHERTGFILLENPLARLGLSLGRMR